MLKNLELYFPILAKTVNVGTARNRKNFTMRLNSIAGFFSQSLVPIETVRLMRSIEDVTLIHSYKSKVTLAQVFSFEFREIFKNTFSIEYLQMAAFVHSHLLIILKHFPIKIWQLEVFVSNAIWSVYSNEKNFKIHFFYMPATWATKAAAFISKENMWLSRKDIATTSKILTRKFLDKYKIILIY